ncbi:MAG: uracil-DNA glycosylase [Ignavibacteriaceae bacterium]|nr:uracil-DNA glycosylase [Ignavibacteriaceae bacterium]
MDKLKEEVINALKVQREIFGDVLFDDKDSVVLTRRTEVVTERIMETETGTVKDTVPDTFKDAKSLEELNSLICNCLKCPLGSTRKNFVFGTGNPKADALVLGEGPGADEDEQGIPFVGRAGKLLNDILKAIKFEREEVYIANIVKCRPPNNRTPFPSEMDTCMPYLRKQIELINPKLILCVGLTAAHGLLNNKDSLTSMRGKVFEFEGRKVMVTYHPAALLRNPNWKRGCWEDVQAFRKLYDEQVKADTK